MRKNMNFAKLAYPRQRFNFNWKISCKAFSIFFLCFLLSACSAVTTNKGRQMFSSQKGLYGRHQKAQLNFRSKLLIPENRTYLPLPGSNVFFLKRKEKNYKEIDAYTLYTRGYTDLSQEEEELSVQKEQIFMQGKFYQNLPQTALMTPPLIYQKPARTAPIGDKGMSEARKDLLRQEDPNLKPTKKPWFSGSKKKD